MSQISDHEHECEYCDSTFDKYLSLSEHKRVFHPFEYGVVSREEWDEIISTSDYVLEIQQELNIERVQAKKLLSETGGWDRIVTPKKAHPKRFIQTVENHENEPLIEKLGGV